MVIGELKGKLVGLDTAPLIYFIEQHPTLHPKVKNVFELHAQQTFGFIVSVLTLTEVLVHPLREKDTKLAAKYKRIFEDAKGVTIAEMNKDIAVKAAELRAKYASLRTPDAIQLATAIHHRCDYFFSNDEALKKITEIEVITINDIA
ncbi:PIN domain-containing protein [Flammeovirgaceae bacterium SG7u.111]|nr:PIN domain-containing protein [Flammeovirgaceae bacterium SG7u.132]WPO33916.1 PIN domain-containing protein [Flammeovirgaceae bacterium SG7u.111]